MLGQRAAGMGLRVDLSRLVVEHHLSDETMAQNFSHRLRWARSTRRSRPAGYFGQLFTNPLPFALILTVFQPSWWPALAATILLRGAAAYATSWRVLRDRLSLRFWWLIPFQDVLSFAFWLAGFSGNTISWRGRHYRLHRDGTFEPIG